MLIIDRDFIERYCLEYDRRNRGTQDQIEEDAILNWMSSQISSRFLNKEYFVRLGRWKTPRYQKTRELNNEKEIIGATQSSYLARNDLEKLNVLKKLKGVGVAVASTILYFMEPNRFAIFDYHVRNTLVQAGNLGKEDDRSSTRVWLKYIRVTRNLSSLNNKNLREVEKALFAYDKWGCGKNAVEGTDKEAKPMDKSEDLLITLSSEKKELLKNLAQAEYGVDASTLAKFWVIEKLLEQCPLTNTSLANTSPSTQIQQPLTIRERIKQVVEKNWSYGQTFSRANLINQIQNAYPEIKKNEIMPADRAINRLSGYHKTNVGWEKKDPYLFARDDNKFERYDPARHGTFECVDDGKGYKKIVSKNA